MTNVVKKILLVDDEERLLNSMGQRLALMGFEVKKASSGTRAIEIVKNNQIDLAIVDLKIPDMDGLITINRLQEITPDLKTVLLTGYGSQKTKQETQKLGSDYFEKDSMGDFWNLIREFKNNGNLVVIKPSDNSAQFRDESLQDHLASHHTGISRNQPEHRFDQQVQQSNFYSGGDRVEDVPKMIGETIEMQTLRKKIKRMSRLDCTIIIQGEAGTGKELAARIIHELSHRKNQRFLAFNCNCFSNDFHFAELLSSLEQSPNHHDIKKYKPMEKRFVGTILLDNFEIMPEQTQQEMIKIIENKSTAKLTDSDEMRLDIRFIVATNQDLKKKVAKKKFNKDLYHGLNAIVLHAPSLIERREDIFPLCSYFLNQLNKEFNKKIQSVSNEVFSLFMSYPFPGNVRELRHIMERAVILANGTSIEIKHLPERFNEKINTSVAIDNQHCLSLKEMEKGHILKTIKLTNGNKSKACKLLGISRGALWRKLKTINAEV
jgi:two-component system response regulator AtoC